MFGADQVYFGGAVKAKFKNGKYLRILVPLRYRPGGVFLPSATNPCGACIVAAKIRWLGNLNKLLRQRRPDHGKHIQGGNIYGADALPASILAE